MDIARRSTDEELYRKLDEDGSKQMIFKVARDRTEDGRETKSGAVIYSIQFNSMVYSHNTVQCAYTICTSYNTMYK